MRRKDREISFKEEITKIIQEERICRLAIKDEPYSYIVPLNYGVEIEDNQITLYFHSALEGRKIDLLKADPKVSFEIDRNHEITFDTEKGSCSTLYECVIGNGEIIFINGEEKLKALRLILQHHGRGEDFPIMEDMVKKTLCYKLTVNKVTGKKHEISKTII